MPTHIGSHRATRLPRYMHLLFLSNLQTVPIYSSQYYYLLCQPFPLFLHTLHTVPTVHTKCFYQLFLPSVSTNCPYQVFLPTVPTKCFYQLFLSSVSTYCSYQVFLPTLPTKFFYQLFQPTLLAVPSVRNNRSCLPYLLFRVLLGVPDGATCACVRTPLTEHRSFARMEMNVRP